LNIKSFTSFSDSGAIMNSSFTSENGQTGEIGRIRGTNNITISCVAVGVLCTAVIIGIIIRRKLRKKFYQKFQRNFPKLTKNKIFKFKK